LEPERKNLRKNWDIPEGAIVFLFVGKLIPKKRPYDFVKAIELACRVSSCIFGLIVGDGPLRSKLQVLSQCSNLPVTFTGFLNQKEMSKAYTVSDVLVLPSDGRETWGLVVNEAFASGLPAIVSDKVGCAPDLIRPGQTGEVFPCGDVKKLAEIFKTFALQREHLREMGRNAYRIIDNYSIANAVEGTLRAIHEVAKKDK
jgi:glycosyltransferase involved in cell wall biosynthesis